MGRVLAIASREYGSFLRVPAGWIIAALFFFLCALTFTRRTMMPGEPASLREFFTLCVLTLIVIAPAISMRLLSEEHRSGTIEPLMAGPASEWSIVLGKFLGAWAFLGACLIPTLVFPVILVTLSPRVDLGPIVCGYLGIMLLGATYIATGELVSSLTNNQTLAFLGTLFLIGVVEFGSARLAMFTDNERLISLLTSLSAAARMAEFAKGVIDTSHVAVFIVVALWFLGLTAIVLRARRWR
jgi:ABC-2 type transport system permease protein